MVTGFVGHGDHCTRIAGLLVGPPELALPNVDRLVERAVLVGLVRVGGEAASLVGAGFLAGRPLLHEDPLGRLHHRRIGKVTLDVGEDCGDASS